MPEFNYPKYFQTVDGTVMVRTDYPLLKHRYSIITDTSSGYPFKYNRYGRSSRRGYAFSKELTKAEVMDLYPEFFI